MVYELRIYNIKPGFTKKVIDTSGTIARRIRGEGDQYGKLEGHWLSTFGSLHRYVHMWSYPDAQEMRRLRTELTSKPAWKNDFVPKIVPYILSQKIRLLRPLSSIEKPNGNNNFYELRFTKLKVGKWKSWTDFLIKNISSSYKTTIRIGIWVSEFSDPNEVIQLYSYSDLSVTDYSNGVYENLDEYKDLIEFQKDIVLEEKNILLRPSPFSPRQ